MPRNIPGTSLQAILAQQTGEAILCLLDITDENGVVYRMSNDSVDTVIDRYYPDNNAWDDTTNDAANYWTHTGSGVQSYSRPGTSVGNVGVKILDVSNKLPDATDYLVNYTVSNIVGNFSTYVWLGANHTSTVTADGTYSHALTSDYTNNSSLVITGVGDTGAASATVKINYIEWASGQVTYLALPFDIIFPDSVDGQQQQATLTLENVSRDLIDEIRLHTLPLVVDMRLVLGSDPTEILAVWNDFKMRQVSYDAMTLQGQLTQASFMNEMVGVLMTGSNFPGLFYV